MTTTLDVVRRIVGRKSKITKDEMGAILMVLVEERLVNLCNGYVRDTCGNDILAASIAWCKACHGISCISVDSRGLRDGQVRYDQPGSMHPMQHSEITFAPDGMRDAEPGSGSTLRYLRQHADRVLVVRQDREPAGEVARQAAMKAVEEARSTTCECENGHRWKTEDPKSKPAKRRQRKRRKIQKALESSI